MTAIVYSTTTCPYCKMVKDYLTQNNVQFTEKLVDQDDAARKEMMDISTGFMGVPFTVIDKDGQKETIIGFDKGKLNQILGLQS
jgi:glutaredoxin 3